MESKPGEEYTKWTYKEVCIHLFMNMCFVVFENDIASSCVYQASWKQIIVAVTLIDVFFGLVFCCVVFC